MKVTLGGDRLGSGNKNKIALRNYERSTHNLTQTFTSSMQCGVLYPFLVIPAMRGDSFSIDLNADGRTIPTKGPLFGSFKMQVDLFQCPWRLYQALLHNNPTRLGLNMKNVMLPRISLPGGHGEPTNMKINNTALLKYLGISGLGTKTTITNAYVRRGFNAIPVLAYYDIFKTYYANKQEENAYVITTKEIPQHEIENVNLQVTFNTEVIDTHSQPVDFLQYLGYPHKLAFTYIFPNKEGVTNYYSGPHFMITNNENDIDLTFKEWVDLFTSHGKKYASDGDIYVSRNVINNQMHITYTFDTKALQNVLYSEDYPSTYRYIVYPGNTWLQPATTHDMTLVPFNLKNIDDMRMSILSFNNLGAAYRIGGTSQNQEWGTTSGTDGTGLPYSALIRYKPNSSHPQNVTPLNGLLVKTYQSDLFNNWVNTEWIDGENGIAAVTAVATSNGKILIDSLNLAEKLYNMLNRVAVADGTYEGWQDAVYTETPKRHIESPVYLGGMSSEIVFEEITQTAPTTNAPLGTLAGKGKVLKRKGGHVNVKVDEASFIIGIVSLTPRINYTQGNEWYMTDLWTMDDLHKPALDGIGFQNLIGEQLAYFDTNFSQDATQFTRSAIGKVPAWINYMTAVDKGFGDFAETEGNGFMLLQRNYEQDIDGTILDATTYIDPQKYNYAFAYTGLDAQNFWVQIHSQITARRLMSAKQIPNI